MTFHLIISSLPILESRFRKRFGPIGVFAAVVGHLAPLLLYFSDFYMGGDDKVIGKIMLPLLLSIFPSALVGFVLRIVYSLIQFAKNKKRYDRVKLVGILAGATAVVWLYRFESELAGKGNEEYSTILLFAIYILIAVIIALPILRWFEN
jgi:hypothetical protein